MGVLDNKKWPSPKFMEMATTAMLITASGWNLIHLGEDQEEEAPAG